MGFTVDDRGEEVVLDDPVSGAWARVLAGTGFNLAGLYLPLAGVPRRVVHGGVPGPDPPGRPTHGGMPALFPFPNRVRDGRMDAPTRE